MSVQREKVSVQQLQFGMFITELDRPWLESPFLLQGFVLDNEEQMEALKRVCEFVYVDRTKSVGDQFGEKAKINVSIKRAAGFSSYKPAIKNSSRAITAPKVVVKSKTTNQQKSIKNSSFYEIISAIKNGDVSETNEGVIFNIKEISPPSSPPSGQSEAQDAVSESGSTFSFLKNIFKKKEKFKDTISAEKNRQNQEDEPEDYRVVIHENEVPNVEQELAVIYPTFAKSQQSIKSLFESIANAQKLDLSTVSDILDSMVESITRTPDALMWLSKLKSSHDGAYNHALNVSINTMAFASFLAMPKTLIKEIGLGGLLQSVGKTTLPKRILEKTSVLTKAEYEIVKTHVVEGLKLLKNNPDIPATALEMVAQHHERYDGSGYPKGLKDTSITIHGQIGGLLDTYCALTTNRNYAHSVNNMMALDEIRMMRDKEFSSELIDQLIQFLGIYPVSSLVELNTGEVAVVIQQNQVRRLLPRVMVVLASDKSRNKFPTTLDLLNAPQTPTGEPYQIIRSLAPNSYGLNPGELYI